MVWDPKTDEMKAVERKKRPYDKVEAIEVKENRGNVCQFHRRRKKKVLY